MDAVDTTELFDGSVDKRPYRVLIAHIEGNTQGPSASRSHLGGDLLGGPGRGVPDHHGGSFFGQPQAGSRADGSRPAGQQRDLPLESPHGPEVSEAWTG